MGEKVTMSEIGKKLGVSTVTVSRALAGKEGVGEEMREKILRTAAEMGYPVRPVLPTPQQDGGTVGILVSCRFIGKGHTFYWTMYERVLECLSDHDLFGILEPVRIEDEEEAALPRIVRNGRVQSLLLIGRFKPQYLQAISLTGLPAVQLDTYTANDPIDSVISDSYHGMYCMTDYLLRRGHRRIAFVGLVGATSSITDRFLGYCRALIEWGLPIRTDWVLPDRKEGEVVTIQLPVEMPTAFACNCDASAWHLMQQLDKFGYRVPEDVSVVGFDGFSLYPITPELTTYAVDMDAMVDASVTQLLDRIAGADADPAQKVIPGRLVEGASVRKLTGDT